MAPVADGEQDARPQRFQYAGSNQNQIPSVTTATIKASGPLGTDTTDVKVAFLINSYFDQQGPHTFTISEFSDLDQAQSAARDLDKARKLASATASQQTIVTSYVGQYQPTPALTTEPQLETTGAVPTAAAIPTISFTTALTPPSPPPSKHGGPKISTLTAGIIIPILVCLATIITAVGCVRHYRRKARKAHAVEMASRSTGPEMKTASANPTAVAVRDERAYIAPANVVPPLPVTTPVASTPATSSAAAEPPVILSTTMNSTYYTGIDTSDVVSVAEDRRSMASRDTFGEEPPPPYRPRSVPPISRDTSLRSTVAGRPVDRHASIRSGAGDRLSGGSLLGRSEMRSPFDDPEEEDEESDGGRDDVSQTSTVRQRVGRRSLDEVSLVSELSNEEGTLPRSTL